MFGAFFAANFFSAFLRSCLFSNSFFASMSFLFFGAKSGENVENVLMDCLERGQLTRTDAVDSIAGEGSGGDYYYRRLSCPLLSLPPLLQYGNHSFINSC